MRQLLAGQRAGVRAVSQHDGAIGDRLHLSEPMRDVDDGDASRAQAGDDLVQPGRLGQRQARRRFVHDQHTGVERERLRDFDELLLGDRQPGDRRLGRHVQPQLREIRPHRIAHLPAVDQAEHAAARGLTPQQHVAGHVQVVEQVQFLMDERDAVRRRRVHVAHHGTARRRSAPRPSRAARCRRRSSSGSTCPRRSRPAARPPLPHGPRGRRRAARARRESACECPEARGPGRPCASPVRVSGRAVASAWPGSRPRCPGE